MPPLNIITHGMRKPKVSQEQVAETLARTNEQAVVRSNHEYRDRQRKIRKHAQNLSFGKDIKGKAVIDAKTYFAWEAEKPGCWGDKQFTKEMLRDNPEMRLD